MILAYQEGVYTKSENNDTNVLLSMSSLKAIFQPILTSGDSSKLNNFIDVFINKFNMRSQTTTPPPFKNDKRVENFPSKVIRNHKTSKGSPKVNFKEPLIGTINNAKKNIHYSEKEIKNSSNPEESKPFQNFMNPKKDEGQRAPIKSSSLLKNIKQEILKKISIRPQNFPFKTEDKETIDQEMHAPVNDYKIKVATGIKRPEGYKIRISPETKRPTIIKNIYKKGENSREDEQEMIKNYTTEKNEEQHEANKNPNFDDVDIHKSNGGEIQERESIYSSSQEMTKKKLSHNHLAQTNLGLNEFSQQIDSLLENYKIKKNIHTENEANSEALAVVHELQQVVKTRGVNDVAELDNLFDELIRKRNSVYKEKFENDQEIAESASTTMVRRVIIFLI